MIFSGMKSFVVVLELTASIPKKVAWNFFKTTMTKTIIFKRKILLLSWKLIFEFSMMMNSNDRFDQKWLLFSQNVIMNNNSSAERILPHGLSWWPDKPRRPSVTWTSATTTSGYRWRWLTPASRLSYATNNAARNSSRYSQVNGRMGNIYWSRDKTDLPLWRHWFCVVAKRRDRAA